MKAIPLSALLDADDTAREHPFHRVPQAGKKVKQLKAVDRRADLIKLIKSLLSS
jgi:hypothetical protein